MRALLTLVTAGITTAGVLFAPDTVQKVLVAALGLVAAALVATGATNYRPRPGADNQNHIGLRK